MRIRIGLLVLLVFGGCWIVFLTVLHPWMMSWGATTDEQTMLLPGDSAPPSIYFTRAITIDAPPATVWLWLMAIGQDRAGFYSNDWLENLAGADIHNSWVLRPAWQQRAQGERIPMAGDVERSAGGDVTLLTVRILDTDQVYADVPGRFVLMPIGDRATRLLLRERLDIPERNGSMWLIWDPLHFTMEQRMLRGIKERAENQPLVPGAAQALALLGWSVAGLGLLALFLIRRQRWLWLVLPVAAGAPAIWLAGDLNGALAGFLAVGITVMGGLMYGWRWWLVYPIIATVVAYTLILAADSYATFGIGFLLLMGGFAGAWEITHWGRATVFRNVWHPRPRRVTL